MKRLAATVAGLVISLAVAGNALAGTYYVSPSGSNTAAGDATHPWQTVTRVNNASLQPGDTVLFQGGATYSDATLMPGQSGSAGAPITFGSYGGGQANLSQGAWFASKSYLTFSNLAVTDPAATSTLSAIQASASGSGSSGIVITGCTLSHVAIGINSANAADGSWTITNNVIQYTRDSGAIVLGHDFTWRGNSILDTGQDSSISYGKHGVYAKGPSQTFVGNTISRFSADGLSLRYANATVEGNTISNGPIAVAWFQVDPGSGGTTVIAYNKIVGTTTSGIYVSPSDEGGSTRESFVIANNTISGSSGNGADIQTTSGNLTVANNLFTGSISPAARLAVPGGSYSEHNNDFAPTSGSPQIPLGTADMAAAPQLAADLTPGSSSPVINHGSAAVASLPYASSCDGALFHYCGSAPDIGAVETGSTSGGTLPPVAPLAAPTALASHGSQTSLSLSWDAAADPRVTSYSVTRNGAAAAVVSGVSATVSGLACGTTSTVAVTSVGSDGSTSAPDTITASTSACSTTGGGGTSGGGTPVKDTTAPWVMITSPAQGATVARSASVLVDATDASGIANVTFWVDSVSTCVDKTAPYSCAVSLPKGAHTLLVRATDKAGNVGWMSVKVQSSGLAPTKTAAAATTKSALKLAPAPGTAVTQRFMLAEHNVSAKAAVSFTLDGKTVCVAKKAPFTCSATARPGWHRAVARVQTTGASKLSVSRFLVR